MNRLCRGAMGMNLWSSGAGAYCHWSPNTRLRSRSGTTVRAAGLGSAAGPFILATASAGLLANARRRERVADFTPASVTRIAGIASTSGGHAARSPWTVHCAGAGEAPDGGPPQGVRAGIEVGTPVAPTAIP